MVILVTLHNMQLAWAVKLGADSHRTTIRAHKIWWVTAIPWSRIRAWSFREACLWWCRIKDSGLPLLKVQELRVCNSKIWVEFKVLFLEVLLQPCDQKWVDRLVLLFQMKWLQIILEIPYSFSKTLARFTIQIKQIWQVISRVISKQWRRWAHLLWIN